MKTYFKTVIILLFATSINAQNEDYKFVAGLHAGYSLTGSLVKAIADSDSESFDSSVRPAVQLTADYALTHNFSIGVAVSHQTVKIDAEDYRYFDSELGMTRTETFTSNFRRSQIAIRPLIHYGNDQVDLYSGLRIGILRRGFTNFSGIENSDRSDDDIAEDLFNDDAVGLVGTRFSLGLTAFGFRYFVTDNIGIGGEVNIGAPYIVNFGVSARL